MSGAAFGLALSAFVGSGGVGLANGPDFDQSRALVAVEEDGDSDDCDENEIRGQVRVTRTLDGEVLVTLRKIRGLAPDTEYRVDWENDGNDDDECDDGDLFHSDQTIGTFKTNSEGKRRVVRFRLPDPFPGCHFHFEIENNESDEDEAESIRSFHPVTEQNCEEKDNNFP